MLALTLHKEKVDILVTTPEGEKILIILIKGKGNSQTTIGVHADRKFKITREPHEQV